MSVLAPALGIGICLVYIGALWWLLRREPAVAFVGLAALCSVALATRVWYTTDYPSGLIEDEPKFLRCAGEALQTGKIFGESCIGIPLLLGSVFEAQLVPLIGPNRWAIRGYSLVTSVLAVPAAFAVGRALMLGISPSLVISAAVAAFPWAIFFGRISLGGELVFHQLLLLAALIRLIWATGGWVEVGFGSVALCALLYDYFAGRVMVGVTLVALLLARGRYRLWCLAILGLAFLGWLPFVLGPQQYAGVGFTAPPSAAALVGSPLQVLWASTQASLRALVVPAGRDDWFTIRSAALHAPWFLALALLGSLTGVRRGLLLWAGFLGGLAPAILGGGMFPSTHRMLMAYPFIAIAAGCAVNLLPWRAIRVPAALLVIVVAIVQSVLLYFSPQFWPVESRNVFDWERTAVVDAIPLPPHPHLILMKHLRYYFGPRMLIDHDYELHEVGNWIPPNGVPTLYAFDRNAGGLRLFYEHILGRDRVQAFGRAFIVTMERGDWSWLREHGWSYEARCGTEVRRILVPVLYHELLGFDTLDCKEPITHSWRGRWLGPAENLRLHFNGVAAVETSSGVALKQDGSEATLDFAVQSNDEVHITVITPPPDPAVSAQVMIVTPLGERVPEWELVSPIASPESG
jgi:hypothetical protein